MGNPWSNQGCCWWDWGLGVVHVPSPGAGARFSHPFKHLSPLQPREGVREAAMHRQKGVKPRAAMAKGWWLLGTPISSLRQRPSAKKQDPDRSLLPQGDGCRRRRDVPALCHPPGTLGGPGEAKGWGHPGLEPPQPPCKPLPLLHTPTGISSLLPSPWQALAPKPGTVTNGCIPHPPPPAPSRHWAQGAKLLVSKEREGSCTPQHGTLRPP